MATLQLRTLQQMVWDRVEQNSLFYPAAEVTAAINEAIRVANLFGGFCQGRVALPYPSIQNRLIYDMPAGMLFPTDVYWEGRALEPTSIQSLNENQPAWFSGLTSPNTEPAYWAAIGLTKFALVPWDQYGGSFLEVAGVMEPVVLVNPTDTSLLPDEWVDIVVDYSYITLVFDEGGAIFNTALGLFKQVQQKISDLAMWEGFGWPAMKSQIQTAR